MIWSCNDDGKAVRHPSSDQTSKSHCPNKDNATKIASPAFPIWKIPKIKKHVSFPTEHFNFQAASLCVGCWSISLSGDDDDGDNDDDDDDEDFYVH